MTVIDEQGRPEPPFGEDEVATLLGFLDYHRATLEWKTQGLDAHALRVRVAASSITLGGLLKHMALVEESWFSHRLHGRGPHPRRGGPFDADPDWEWNAAADDSPEQLREQWTEAVARSRELVAEALADGGLDTRATGPPWPPEDTRPTLRWSLVHMIEEYARHNGHADLIREQIDGQTVE